jgi:hypothetical protein
MMHADLYIHQIEPVEIDPQLVCGEPHLGIRLRDGGHSFSVHIYMKTAAQSEALGEALVNAGREMLAQTNFRKAVEAAREPEVVLMKESC